MKGCGLVSYFRRFTCGFILASFLTSVLIPSGLAQELSLSASGQMVSLTPSFTPCLLRGLKFDAQTPLNLKFILDEGDAGLEADALRDESEMLIKFFLASLTTPEKDIWVNLSPYESGRIIANDFGRTTMGRELLAQDYLLKQLTSSLMHPDAQLGKKFWTEVYRDAAEKYGTTDIPLDTFNKVWIVPNKAVIYEGRHGADVAKEVTAFIDKASLKVMLESDYLAASQAGDPAGRPYNADGDLARSNNLTGDRRGDALASLPLGRHNDESQKFVREMIREVIVPALEKEVNEGKSFARLRQAYHALLLAVWLKKKLSTAIVKEVSSEKKTDILSRIFLDQNKTSGIETKHPQAEILGIYDLYVQAFRSGVYDLVKDEYDQYAGELIPRKYFSGGMEFGAVENAMVTKEGSPSVDLKSARVVEVALQGIKRVGSLALRVGLFTMIAGPLVLNGPAGMAQTSVPSSVSVKHVVEGRTDSMPMETEMVRKLFEAAGGVKYHLDGVGSVVPLTAKEVAARMKMSPESFYKVVKADYEKYHQAFEAADLSLEDVLAFVLATACIETAFDAGKKSPNGLYYGFGQFGQGAFNIVMKFAPELKAKGLSNLLKSELSVRFIIAYLARIAPIVHDQISELIQYDARKKSKSVMQHVNRTILTVLFIKAMWGLGEDREISTYWEMMRSALKRWKGWKRGVLVDDLTRIVFTFNALRNVLTEPLSISPGGIEKVQPAATHKDQAQEPLGGIDLQTDGMDLKSQGQIGDVEFDLTPDQVDVLKRGVAGFTPVIKGVERVADYREFLGLNN